MTFAATRCLRLPLPPSRQMPGYAHANPNILWGLAKTLHVSFTFTFQCHWPWGFLLEPKWPPM